MWHCPNCGEQIDDTFDACWKCGTAHDGTRAADFDAEPPDSDTPDSGPEADSPDEEAKDFVAAAGAMKQGRIVELCSAANIIEADAIRDLLEEAGIQSRVVGEFLGSAAGSLPLGETTTPRIWVHAENLTRAQKIIDEQMDRLGQETSALSESDENTESDIVPDGESPPAASGAGGRWLGQGLVLLGLACIAVGAIWAGLNWATLRDFPGTAQGVLVAWERQFSTHSSPPPEIPFRRDPTITSSTCYVAEYSFIVKGKTYYSKFRTGWLIHRHRLIHYDPRQPTRNFVGSVTAPWSILGWTLGIGIALLLMGYRSRLAGASSVDTQVPGGAGNED